MQNNEECLVSDRKPKHLFARCLAEKACGDATLNKLNTAGCRANLYN